MEKSEKVKARQAKWEKKARRIDEYQYKNRPAWQTQKTITYAKLWMWFLRICCVGTLILAFFGLFWKTIWLYLILPIAIQITYVIFHQAVILFEYPKDMPPERKKLYFRYPWFSQAFLMMIGIEVLFFMDFQNVSALVFGLAMFAVLGGLIWELTDTPFGHHESSMVAVCFVAFYCFMGTYAWNWVGTVGEPEHVQATIISERKIVTQRGSDEYCFLVEKEDGTEEELAVRRSLYDQADPGDKVWICERRSVFNVPYCIVHLSECFPK